MSQQVYVLHQDGTPLMPTTPAKARHLLEAGRAVVVRRAPFTIQLLLPSGKNTQPLLAGVDLGTAHVGISVVSDQQEVFAGEFKLRTDISRLLTQRRELRRTRRSRRTRYRKPRFLNRGRAQGWLPPSVQAKVDEALKAICLVSEILPVTHWTFEIGNFDLHKIANPEVEGVDYQQGQQYGFLNAREYVLWRDQHTCQGCQGKSGDPILTVHHIRPRKDIGSDRPENLITLCQTCHRAHHDGTKLLKLETPETLRDVTQINILKAYVMRATTELPRSVTFGYLTKAKRSELGLCKTHLNDAFVVAGGTDQERVKTYYLGVFARRQNRKLYKGARSHIRNTLPAAFGFRRGDRVRLEDGPEGFIHGLRSSGYFDVRRLSGEVLSHSISWKILQRVETARTLRIEANQVPEEQVAL
jgi:hypothetical protein